ncbi:spermidine synthase [Neptunicella sp. SCSIO 80796]|uniref:spermidine synthase n=1 Tax=Neptunicella plasticusilytica TaxID=3117012 RepID=UPI003A4E0F9D
MNQSLLYLNQSAGLQALSVLQNEHYCWLEINNTVHSVMCRSNPAQLILPHLHPMMLALYFAPQAKNALELGLGGGAIQRYLAQHSRIELTSVELRTDVIASFERYFNPARLGAKIIQIDAQQYLPQSGKTDLLFVDLFDHQHCPAFLFEPDFYHKCHLALSSQGILIVNLLPVSEFQVEQVTHLLRQQFGQQTLCFSVPGYINRVLMVSEQPLPAISFDADFFDFVQRSQIDLNLFVLDS